MKNFAMSKYISTEALYKDKAEYYEGLFRMLADRMVETEELGYDEEEDAYYDTNTGDRL